MRVILSRGAITIAPSFFSSYAMPWRSRSLTIAAESSGVRSVNTGDICGAVTRRMMKANRPTSAAVTAAMAPRRAAPSVRMNSINPCTDCAPAISAPSGAQIQPGKFCRVHGFDLVNGSRAPQKQQRRPKGRRAVSVSLGIGRLLPILLDTRGTQAGETVTVDGILPGEKLLDRQRVARARLFE